MPRVRPADLSLQGPAAGQNPNSRSSSPINVDISTFGGEFVQSSPRAVESPSQPIPPSPPTSPKAGKTTTKSLFSSSKARGKDLDTKLYASQVRDDRENTQGGNSSLSKLYHLNKNTGSTPELSLVGSAERVDKTRDVEDHNHNSNAQGPESPPTITPVPIIKRRDRTFRNPLIRTKSRSDSKSKSDGPRPVFAQPPNTAPLVADWPGSEMRMMQTPQGRERRGKSAERAIASESDDNVSENRTIFAKESQKEKSSFMSGGRHVVSKAKAGGGNFLTRLGKIGRSGSSNEKDIPDSEYVIKIINKPLVEQTRITRISKDLSSCRDKTEYWMPSLPWRCIDYLNLNCETEGLYRVPGSGPQVKMWQRRFDTELDVDLLDEKELYDPNNISSMLKSWLRELPTEIMPSSVQAALSSELERENPDYQKIGQPAPQRLRDALSNLPPFNYYLLFAVTCHLSLLLSHKDKNKMDLNNLSICIGPCLRMDRWLFNYLVGDWRHCWQGCSTEKEYLEIEKAHDLGIEYLPLSIPSTNGSLQPLAIDERTIDSRGSGSAIAMHDAQTRKSAEHWHTSANDQNLSRRTHVTASDGKQSGVHHSSYETSRGQNGRSWLDT